MTPRLEDAKKFGIIENPLLEDKNGKRLTWRQLLNTDQDQFLHHRLQNRRQADRGQIMDKPSQPFLHHKPMHFPHIHHQSSMHTLRRSALISAQTGSVERRRLLADIFTAGVQGEGEDALNSEEDITFGATVVVAVGKTRDFQADPKEEEFEEVGDVGEEVGGAELVRVVEWLQTARLEDRRDVPLIKIFYK